MRMRALLIVPAGSEALEAALRSDADDVIVDLSDAGGANPPPSSGDGKRRGGIHAFVHSPDADLDAVMRNAPDGVVLRSCESGREVARLGARLAVREARAGLPDGAIRIVAMVETARGVLGLPSLAGSSRRLAGIAWDAVALAAELGAPASRHPDLIPALARVRTLVRLAAAAAGVEAIDTAYPAGRDRAGLLREVSDARRDGFHAKLASSLDQVGAIGATPPAGA